MGNNARTDTRATRPPLATLLFSLSIRIRRVVVRSSLITLEKFVGQTFSRNQFDSNLHVARYYTVLIYNHRHQYIYIYYIIVN